MLLNYLVFKKLADFCRENNKKLCVALVSNRREKKYKIKPENEIKFFKSIDENFLYILLVFL